MVQVDRRPYDNCGVDDHHDKHFDDDDVDREIVDDEDADDRRMMTPTKMTMIKSHTRPFTRI